MPRPSTRKPPPPSTNKSQQQQPPSALALEHNISASTERSIREAFLLFATPSPPTSTSNNDNKNNNKSTPRKNNDNNNKDNLTTHTLPSSRLKPALAALSLTRIPKTELLSLLDAADPLSTDSITYAAFLGVAALKLNSLSSSSSSNRDGEEQARRRREQEIDEAFGLFVGEVGGGGGGGGGEEEEEGVITMGTLRQVARALKEDVDDGVLRDMVLEANGGRGVRAGVGREEFGEVMRRAGVLR